MTGRKESLTISARRDMVSWVRRWLGEVLDGWAVQDAAAGLLLAVSGVCNNIIRHGYQDEGDGEIQIEAFLKEDQVCLIATDAAPPFLPCFGVTPALVDPLADSGRGLFLIDALMDEVSHQTLANGGNRTVLVKQVPLVLRRGLPF